MKRILLAVMLGTSLLGFAQSSREKTKEINRILMNDYREDNEISDTQTTYNWKELVWPIEHSN